MVAHLLALAAFAAVPAAQQPIDAELVVSGLSSPIFVCAAPGDDASRIFVVTQPGRIRIIENGALLPTPFLDLASRLNSGGERGLLGLAFHPDYRQNGYFFVNYTDNTGGDTVIERYSVTSDPNVADPNSGFLILEVDQPYSNHNAGWLGFGPDGYLYVPLGDGGSGGDPGNRAQNGQQLLGKILRLDVDGGSPYAIPPTNPFVGDPNVRDEIWAIGTRNPWRCDFDALTGDLWIADVGQNTWEEIDYEPAGQGGRNYGWRIMEGNHCYNPSSGCNQSGLTLPIHEYSHSFGCSVTGGVLYRGRAMATMHGRYFFSDYCNALTWSFRQSSGVKTDFVDHSAELNGLASITSWGEDADGEAYVCAGSNVWRVVPAGLRLRAPRLVSGGQATVSVTGGTPLTQCGLFFSLHGLGSTPVPPAGVVLDLAGAHLLAARHADAGGATRFSGTVPAHLQGRTLWLQAVQLGQKSNAAVQPVD